MPIIACTYCGAEIKPADLIAAGIEPEELQSTDDPEEYFTVCEECHQSIHENELDLAEEQHLYEQKQKFNGYLSRIGCFVLIVIIASLVLAQAWQSVQQGFSR